MPLVRKPGLALPATAPDAVGVLQALGSADADERWSAARAAPTVPGSEGALAQALGVEDDDRVREAMLTSLAQLGTPASLEPLLSMLRSERAASRTAALGALRLTPPLTQVVTQLLRDPDSDVRLLSCELARSLPVAQSNSMLMDLLRREAHPNVCAAAVEVLAEVGEPEALAALAACAKRFSTHEFLVFAIDTVVERINASALSTRV